MDRYEIITHIPETTMEFASKLAVLLNPKDVITLEGDLGAGKTTFTKGLAKGLGIKRNVNSPTFTIIKEYQGRFPLYHMDVYRVEEGSEELGLEEYFEGDGVTVVEWAHLIEQQLPEQHLKISILHEDEVSRKIILHPIGERYAQICKEILGK